MPKTTRLALALGLTLAAGCSGGATSTPVDPPPPPPAAAGIALPKEISALPAVTSTGGASLRGLRSAALATPGGDYAAAKTVTWVNEPELDAFDILNTIFGALDQTHYADPANVNAGPYAAIVSWVENQGDGAGKQLKRWVVDSTLVQVDGATVNRVKVWTVEGGGGKGPFLVRVLIDIRQAPARNADGTYADYGIWRLVAKFDDAGTRYFVAAADVVDGRARVGVHQVEDGQEMTGLLVRSAGAGFGKISYPQQCYTQGCVPTNVTVAYAYDADHVMVVPEGGDPIYKDRQNPVDVVNRYGLFDATTGDDVRRSRNFGFPVSWTDAGGDHYAYYGAWQGHHQLWANGEAVPAGLAVTRGDRAAAGAPTYTTSDVFQGVLVRRDYAPATLAELQGLVLQTWLNDSGELEKLDTGWNLCRNPYWPQGAMQPTCGDGSGPITDLSWMIWNPADPSRQVSLNRWDQQQQRSVSYVFDGTHFWEAQPGPNGLQPTQTEWIPQLHDRVWANVSGPAWLSWDGQGWEKKEVLSVDPQTQTPTFGTHDTAFAFTAGQGDHFLNANGVTYVLRQDGTVQIERQVVANPVSAALFLPAGLRFRRGWGGDTASTFAFGTDAGAPATFMKLIYDVPGQQDAANGRQPGDLVTEGIWNLQPVLDGQVQPGSYSWEWNDGSNGGGFGAQQFLRDGSTWIILDDPIRLAPVSLADGAGGVRSYALQFDGSWVGGLPDTWRLLQSTGGEMTSGVADRIVVVPEGTVVTDASDASKHYVFKALEQSQYLRLLDVPPAGLSVTAAQGLDLASAPAYADNGVGARPDVPVKYSEGVPVTP